MVPNTVRLELMREKRSVDAGQFFFPLLITVIFNSFRSSGKKKTQETESFRLRHLAAASARRLLFWQQLRRAAGCSTSAWLPRLSESRTGAAWCSRPGSGQPGGRLLASTLLTGIAKASPSDCREPLHVAQTSCLWQDKLFTFWFMQQVLPRRWEAAKR